MDPEENNDFGSNDVAAALADIESGAAGEYDDNFADDGGEQELNGAGADAGDAPKEEIADEGSAEDSAGQAEEAAASDAEANAVEPPSDLSAEEKEAFSKLTPEAQKLLAEYSSRSQVSRSKLSNDLDGLKKQSEPLMEALKPYDQLIQQAGATPQQVVSNLMPYYKNLVTGDADTKRKTIEFLAEQFGVELGAPQKPDEQQADQGNEYVDPEIAALKKKIAELEGTVTKTSTSLEERDRAQEQQRLSEAQAKIDNFRNEKDDKGELKRPHYDKLEEPMTALMKGGLAKTLEEAYEKAARLDPEIQALSEKAKADAKRAEDAKKAAEAKKSQAANRKGDGTPGKRSEALTIKDAVLEAYDELEATA